MVRPITTHDVGAVSLLLHAAIEGGGHTTIESLRAAIATTHKVGFCWVGDGIIQGAITGQCVADESEIHELAVHRDSRRSGIASAMLHAFLHESARRNAYTCWLEVRASNTGALAFYGHHGFERSGQRPHYYSNGESAVVLRRGLKA